MLREEFKIWLTNPIFDVIFIIIDMHVSNLDYLKNKSLSFTKVPDSGIKKSNKMMVGLDITAIILKTDN